MDKIKHLWCAWFGHSRVVTGFMGYVYCGRCDDQLGDNLASVYCLDGHVMIECPNGIGCKPCHDNWDDLRWHEKILIPNPFTEAPDD